MRLLTALLAAAAQGACSIAMPPGPRGESFVADASEVTALDPQGEGAGVNWDNPQTGAKGSFTPVGAAYPTDGKICRAFLAEVATQETQERLQGTACREKTIEWTLLEVKPWKRG